jgi:hypothetical protein
MNQNIHLPKLSFADGFRGFLLALLVLIGTFPENDWSFSPGIDPPLFWVFNHLFDTGLNIGRHIIFPHGPLAFFMYPLSENILLATLVVSLLKGLLVFNVVFLFSDSKSLFKWFAAFVFAYLLSILGHFNHLILANILLLYCNYFQSNFKPYKFLAFVLTAFAFFVKAYVAIVAGTLFFSFVVYLFLQHKNFKKLLIDGLLLFGFMVFFWLLMFGTPRGFLNFVWGMFHLAQDNSSAASYYPQNNWIVLVLFMLSLLALFFTNRTKKSLFFGLLIALSLFASWKHAMAREDIFHTKGFLIYLIVCLFSFILFHRKNYARNLILAVFAIFLFSVNMKNAVNYYSYKYELFRVNNFVEFVSDFKSLKEKSEQSSLNKSVQNRLPKSILDEVSNATVDVYPWDYSIAAVNHLNWQPRVVIQSYAAYTSWLDKQNATHFSSELAPEYLIWENEKTTIDVNGCDLNSLDNRYLLNDEPQTIIELIRNYDLTISEGKFRLYKKREAALLFERNKIEERETNWGEWIDVPVVSNELLRVKLAFTKNLKQRLKSFLFKDEQFWIYLKLTDGSIHKYRIVPKNAADGLWINPYIFGNRKVREIDKIMFKVSNQNMMSQNLSLEWETLVFPDSPKRISNFFDLDYDLSDSLLYESTNYFEQNETEYWSNISDDRLSTSAYKGEKAHTLNDNPYSSTFSFPLDSIPFGKLRIAADAWVNSVGYKNFKNISLVISIENEKGNLIYKSINIDEQLIDRKQWNHIYKFVEFNHQEPNCKVGVYFWNNGKEEIFIDDFRVMIFSENQ